ncbi:uncharacterized protein LOC119192540 [Manduca sexta]|uniref:uncharacterized protein LOC119192540 n=1 Tax=Manduca sexta TaxID=7130 RepID=UPI0018903E82|nr:uncharacterized protein LOC119192540 [Manduca sexta]
MGSTGLTLADLPNIFIMIGALVALFVMLVILLRGRQRSNKGITLFATCIPCHAVVGESIISGINSRLLGKASTKHTLSLSPKGQAEEQQVHHAFCHVYSMPHCDRDSIISGINSRLLA